MRELLKTLNITIIFRFRDKIPIVLIPKKLFLSCFIIEKKIEIENFL